MIVDYVDAEGAVRREQSGVDASYNRIELDVLRRSEDLYTEFHPKIKL